LYDQQHYHSGVGILQQWRWQRGRVGVILEGAAVAIVFIISAAAAAPPWQKKEQPHYSGDSVAATWKQRWHYSSSGSRDNLS